MGVDDYFVRPLRLILFGGSTASERIAKESMLTLFMTISGTCQGNKKEEAI